MMVLLQAYIVGTIIIMRIAGNSLLKLKKWRDIKRQKMKKEENLLYVAKITRNWCQIRHSYSVNILKMRLIGQSLLRSKALFLVYFRSFSDRSSQGFIRSKNYSIIENFYWMIFRMCFLILENWKRWYLGLLKNRIWNNLLVDKYKIVHHHSKVVHKGKMLHKRCIRARLQNCPLSEPIRLQDLEDSARSKA